MEMADLSAVQSSASLLCGHGRAGLKTAQRPPDSSFTVTTCYIQRLSELTRDSVLILINAVIENHEVTFWCKDFYKINEPSPSAGEEYIRLLYTGIPFLSLCAHSLEVHHSGWNAKKSACFLVSRPIITAFYKDLTKNSWIATLVE
jgi:hypothetical protein